MGFDFGEALASGIASGAGAVEQQQQQQNDDARWLERQQKMQAMETDSRMKLERFMLGLKPSETRKLNVKDDKGQPAIQQQEFVVPEGANKGAWQNVGDQTPDINFERLAETQKNNEERNKLVGERNQTMADLGAARIDAARERLAAENERRKSTGDSDKGDWEVREQASPSGAVSYIRVNKRTGDVQPLTMNGTPVTSFRGGEKLAEEAQKQAKVDAVKGTLSQFASAIGLGKVADALPTMSAGSAPRPSTPAATPAPAGAQPGASPHGKVVRTGTKNGQRVAQYEDGYIGPAP